jgi:hypothetical protein
MHRRTVGLWLVAGLLAGCTAGGRPATTPPVLDVLPDATTSGPRTVTTTALDGNRVVAGTLPRDTSSITLAASPSPTRLLAAPVKGGHLLVSVDGTATAGWLVADTGVLHTLGDDAVAALGAPTTGRPALVREGTSWRFADAAAPLGDAAWVVDGRVLALDGVGGFAVDGRQVLDDVLPDALLAVSDGRAVLLAGPTDRYRHAVLVDAVEASAVVVVDLATATVVRRTEVADDEVIEGLGALLADVDGDGTVEILVTVSDPEGGARQVVLAGGRRIDGQPVGTGNRWRHLVGVARGEVTEVVTPHLDRILRTSVVRDGELVATGSIRDTVASHTIGSRDLDRALLVVEGSTTLLVGPAARDPSVLRAVDRLVDGDGGVRDVALGAPVSSNLIGWSVGGRVVLAVGTADGRVHLLGLP